MILANVDFSDVPQLQGKFLNSTVIVRNGRRIGIIGIITKDTNVRAGKCFSKTTHHSIENRRNRSKLN